MGGAGGFLGSFLTWLDFAWLFPVCEGSERRSELRGLDRPSIFAFRGTGRSSSRSGCGTVASAMVFGAADRGTRPESLGGDC